MFVYIKYENSIRRTLFGPATQGECESWLKIMKIYPREACLWWRPRLCGQSGEDIDKRCDEPWI